MKYLKNAKMRTVVVDGIPKLALFAERDIQSGSEILFDYGVDDLPWRKSKPCGKYLVKIILAKCF